MHKPRRLQVFQQAAQCIVQRKVVKLLVAVRSWFAFLTAVRYIFVEIKFSPSERNGVQISLHLDFLLMTL